MAHILSAIDSPWLLTTLALGVVCGPLAMRFVGRRRARFLRRLEAVYAEFDPAA